MNTEPDVNLSSLTIDRGNAPRRVVRTPKRGKRRLWLWIAGGVLLLIVILGMSGALSGPPTVLTTSISEVSPAQTRQQLLASGYVVAQRKAAVASKGTGRLVALHVVEGDRVRADQVIARLESSDMEAAIAQARAAIDNGKALLLQAEAEQADAKAQGGRARNLHAVGSLSQSDLDVAEARLKRAEAAVAAARAGIRASEAALRAAEIQLENTRIRAPFDGTVLTKNADVGEVVAPFGAASNSRGAVVTMADMTSLEVEADVSESNIQRISLDQPCEITLDAYPEHRYKGRVSKIVPTADRTKATVMTKVRFLDLDGKVLPEMSAKVTFLDKDADISLVDQPRIMTVNPDALATVDGKTVVFVVREGAVKRVSVTRGRNLGTTVEIQGAVKTGDKVVLQPGEELKDGDAVQIGSH